MKAWVITKEDMQSREVIGIISSRKNIKVVKEYVEWLYGLISYDAKEQLATNRDNRPVRIHEGIVDTRCSVVHCGDTPWLVARLARNIVIKNSHGNEIFEWTNPDRPEIDYSTHTIKRKVLGTKEKAPISMPLSLKSKCRE